MAIALLVGTGAAIAQAPNEIWGAIYNSIAPSLSDRQSSSFQATSAGRLNVTGLGPPPTCDGTIDLSTGCVQPMFRGL